MFFPDVPLSAINYAFVLGITCLTVFCNFTKSSSEFSGYLSKVLRNYTEQACDGDFLSVRCPPRTTITVQSAFYGRKGPSHPQQCPSYPRYTLVGTHPLEDDTYCYMSTALQKMLDECQDRRICQVLVTSRLFGMDPCPSSSKYLIVWYKCMPNEYKSTVVCEEERMKLSCKQGMQIAVYSAMFGRTQQGTLECPTHHRAPSVDCQSGVALQVLMARCQGKRSCLVRASTREFGDPCYSGTRKYLSVIYTCVPKNLLQQVPSPRVPVFYPPPPRAHDPNVVGDSGPPDETSIITSDTVLSVIPSGKKKRGRESGSYSGEVKTNEEGVEESAPQPPDMNPVINATTGSTNMALISSALAAYNYIADHPERAALYFLCGVCLGLFFTLFALVVQISCRTDCQPRRRPGTITKKRPRPSGSSSDSRDSDSDTTSDLSARRHRRFERTLNMNVFTSAEELERAQRLEERERIIREIWMNGQPDIPGTRSLNRYY
ncbi:protein eva-1 homolog C-like isoform X1 [Salvelinus fontinalis]|uniref:protein eva-1 homolog C-like isoform X1 n=2 Tax=Salvelinus fontinalis TaxID=8038 RepID=UPI002485B85B|nr:protein eva-1 homolog C-like isoform X1 [Salvelinus fontinalis]